MCDALTTKTNRIYLLFLLNHRKKDTEKGNFLEEKEKKRYCEDRKNDKSISKQQKCHFFPIFTHHTKILKHWPGLKSSQSLRFWIWWTRNLKNRSATYRSDSLYLLFIIIWSYMKMTGFRLLLQIFEFSKQILWMYIGWIKHFSLFVFLIFFLFNLIIYIILLYLMAMKYIALSLI